MSLKLRFLLLSNYLNMLGYALFAPLYAVFALRVGANIVQVGAIWGFYSALSGLFTLFFGSLENEKSGMRLEIPIIVGYFLLALGSLAFLVVQDVKILAIVQAFNALGIGILTPAWKSIYALNQDKGKESGEWALFDGGNMLLLALGSVAGGYFVNAFGFRSLFWVMFAIQIIAALLSLELLRNVRSSNGHIIQRNP